MNAAHHDHEGNFSTRPEAACERAAKIHDRAARAVGAEATKHLDQELYRLEAEGRLSHLLAPAHHGGCS